MQSLNAATGALSHPPFVRSNCATKLHISWQGRCVPRESSDGVMYYMNLCLFLVLHTSQPEH